MTDPDEQARRTEEAWREIVDNYGDRAELDSPEPDAGTTGHDTPVPEPEPEPDAPEPPDDLLGEDEGFVPPPAPPFPRPTLRRGVAWAGVFVSPVIALVLLVAQVHLPAALDLLLIAWFIGGFGYLVVTMRNDPRDPWDDGSRV